LADHAAIFLPSNKIRVRKAVRIRPPQPAPGMAGQGFAARAANGIADARRQRGR
jgi:hypothetical protein